MFLMKKAYLLFYCAYFIIFYGSCTKDKGMLPFSSGVSQSLCDSLNVKFSSDINPIIQNNCAVSGCHTSSAMAGGIDYSIGYAAIDTGRIRARVLVGPPANSWMPPAGPLSASDREKIECWIKDGAHNN